jgi:hypothetical protein
MDSRRLCGHVLSSAAHRRCGLHHSCAACGPRVEAVVALRNEKLGRANYPQVPDG